MRSIDPSVSTSLVFSKEVESVEMRSWTWWFGLFVAMAQARELDPAACSSRFDVQRDKIIRTEESREMGAKYLSELDVGSRQECLRLCCETDMCDVFIYEEKSPGSCYLFNCGPPEDFRCKFTSHGNFSSGVMALSRHLAELQDQERLAHHEQELANLRSITSTTVHTTTVTTPRPEPHAEVPKTASRRCSRYQFECHSGGECIAVYNACDGIPQCADGSDEAPELGCPSVPPIETAAKTSTTPAPFKISQGPVEAGLDRGLVAEPAVIANDGWPHRLTQAQQHHYIPNAIEAAPSSHIFSHKGGLLQENNNNVMSNGMMGQYQQFEPAWQRRPWNPPAPPVDAMAGEHWGGAVAGYPRYDWAEPVPGRAWPVPQPRPEMEMPVYMPPKTMPETPNIYTNQQQTLRDSPKKGFDLIAKVPVLEAVTTVAVEVKKEETRKEKVVAENTTKKKELKVEPAQKPSPQPPQPTKPPQPAHEHFTSMDEHDGLSEHPPAAVMLLILGTLMTTVLGLMLGCRVRAIRRRMRRGKSSFAHDADYLVNGMYL